MNIVKLSLANLKFRALNNFFNILVLALGVAMIVALLHLSQQVEQRFTKDLQDIDLVVGAKGSPLQLILSSVFHLDIPNGNIPLEDAAELEKNPMIKAAIPLALGDNYNGYRIIGTPVDYINHYGGELAQGKLYTQEMQAVIGSEAAAKYNLKLGDKIVGAHGLVNSDDLHTDFPYTITGILKPNGSVLDRLVLTPVESVWHVHEHPDDDDPEEVAYKKAHPGKEITALLITYRTPYAAATLPRMINQSAHLQAASPAFEMARLLKVVGVGSNGIKVFASLLIALAALGFFVTLFNAVRDRAYDIALMRSLGATRRKVFGFVLAEGLALGVCGTICGLILGHVLAYFGQRWIETSRHMALGSVGFHRYEWIIIAAALLISIVASIIPAWMAYRVNVAKTLSRGS